MKVNKRTKDYYAALVGKTVQRVSYYDMGNGGDDAPVLVFTDGTEATVQCDPEGNGPGFLNIAEGATCGACKRGIAASEDYYQVTDPSGGMLPQCGPGTKKKASIP